jgi:hypothetical protein
MNFYAEKLKLDKLNELLSSVVVELNAFKSGENDGLFTVMTDLNQKMEELNNKNDHDLLREH